MATSIDILMVVATFTFGIANIVQFALSQRTQGIFFAKLASAVLKAHEGDLKPLDDLANQKPWSARFFEWLASVWRQIRVGRPLAYSSRLNGTKILMDFSAFSPEMGQDPEGAAKATCKEVFKCYNFVASALEYHKRGQQAVELRKKMTALESSVKALEKKIKGIDPSGNAAADQPIYNELNQKKEKASDELASTKTEYEAKTIECRVSMDKYSKFKELIRNDNSWKANIALHRLLQRAEKFDPANLV